jgi:thymidylate synthase (FAD)
MQMMDPLVVIQGLTPNAERHIEYCARFCYNTLDKMTNDSYKRFLPARLKQGHFSILSHAHCSFVITGISRACSHQLVRHAHLRYLQRSQRYCDESKDAFVTPNMQNTASSIATCADAPSLYGATVKDAFQAYRNLKFAGMKGEDARYVLPNACKTQIVVSGTLQGWWDFLRLRMGKHAQWEIRQIAQFVYSLLHEHMPTIFTPELLTVIPALNLEFPE